MEVMNKEELAKILNGSEYPFRMDKDLVYKSINNNLVVIYGSSDDNCCALGSIDDEFGCYNGGSAKIDSSGFIQKWDENRRYTESDAQDYFNRKDGGKTIKALWCEEEPYSWTYETEIPHETFDILEDGEPFCRGIVFSLDDL